MHKHARCASSALGPRVQVASKWKKIFLDAKNLFVLYSYSFASKGPSEIGLKNIFLNIKKKSYGTCHLDAVICMQSIRNKVEICVQVDFEVTWTA